MKKQNKPDGITVTTVDNAEDLPTDADIMLVAGGGLGMGMAMAAMAVLVAGSEHEEQTDAFGNVIVDLKATSYDLPSEVSLEDIMNFPVFKDEDPGAKARRLFDPAPKSARKGQR